MTKKATAKTERINYKAATTRLADCAVFALRYLGTKGGSGLTFDRATHKITRWQDDFMDALEAAGIVIDRADYWNAKKSTKRSKSR